MKKEIPIILCKLEKIFPPAFFDVMVHLAVHLPEEALLRGPVQYGWMYPVERRLYTLKRYVRNRARPEGSIAEAYIADECLTFCSKYMDDFETISYQKPRNVGYSDEEAYGVDVFGHGVNFTSGYEYQYVYDKKEFDQMMWYALNNCGQTQKYIEMFRDELKRKRVPNIDKELQKEFQTWFKNYIMRLRDEHSEEIDEDLFSLACEPDQRVRKYSSCIVNGIRYSTVDCESNKRTQNNGVMAKGEHASKVIDFYGTLKEIIQLDYNSNDNLDGRSVILFKCDWFKLDGKKKELKNDRFFKSINVESLWYKDDSLILATQARKIFYLPDTKYGENWQVVQTFDRRHLFNISETEGAPFTGPAYQEEECCDEEGTRTSVSEHTSEKTLHRDNEQ
uniref:DUF4218 domain-containing protein n=1 Tax=Triticum urartu TaxID=4572 RepID=A0A8R7TU01_TRIUA